MKKRMHWKSPLDPGHEDFEVSEEYKEGYEPHENIFLETEEECQQAFVTGGVTGFVRLNDGTIYDLTPNIILVPVNHHDALNHHISKKHEVLSAQLGDKAPMGAGYKAVGEDKTNA